MKALYVEWVDSCTTYGWQSPDKDGTSLIRSLGLVVSETPKSVTLSTSRSDGGRFVDQIAIPRSCIRKVRRVRL